MRKNKWVEVFKDENHYGLPRGAIEFIAFFQDKLELVPQEFKESITIDVEAASGMYDESGPELSITISYERPETDIEMEGREAKEHAFIDSARAGKLAAYNKLKLELEL